MKRINYFIFIAFAATAIASCQKEYTNLADSQQITLKPYTGELSKAPIAGTVFPENRTIVLSAYHNTASGNGSNYFSGICFNKVGSTWTGNKFWPSGGSLDFLAYSSDGLSITPEYGSNVSTSVTLNVPDNSTVQSDILWGYATDQTSGGATNIMLRHAEAAIAFTAKSVAEYNATANTGITITGITLKGVKSSGSVILQNSTSCAWSNLSNARDMELQGFPSGYDVPCSAVDIGSAAFGIGSIGMIVIPQTATSVTVTYTAHNGRDGNGNAIDNINLQADCTLSGDWAAGKKYVYALEFAENISISASVYDWISDEHGVTVKKEPSASYSVNAEKEVMLPPSTLSAGSVVGIDWGDGNTEIFSTNTGNDIAPTHTYNTPFTGTVVINVLQGSMDFGKVNDTLFALFTVKDNEKVLMENTNVIGPFTVDSSGTKVYFTTGNLYWDGTAFKLEKYQYEQAESVDINTMEVDPQHIGNFFWSKSTSVAITHPFNESESDMDDKIFAANGGVMNGYSVLSADEYRYLIEHAQASHPIVDPNNIPYNFEYIFEINGTRCVIFAPDGFSGTLKDRYTVNEWKHMEEEYGLLALPAMTNYSMPTGSSNVTYNGYYWAVDRKSNHSEYSDGYAYLLVTGTNKQCSTYTQTCSFPAAIRLVLYENH